MEPNMPSNRVNPAELEGEALKRWYQRSPGEIEKDRQAAEDERYQAFFGREPSNSEANSAPATPTAAEREADTLWIVNGWGEYRKIQPGSSDFQTKLEPERPADYPPYLPTDPAASEQGELHEIRNPENRRLRREWEVANGKPWPRTPDGRPYDVAHIKAIADGGTNTLDNIRPMDPGEHTASHIDDQRRWGRRAGTAKAFGGTVEPPLHARRPALKLRSNGFDVWDIIPDITGILSGRIRTDTPMHFWWDMAGYPAPDDDDRPIDPSCQGMSIAKPGMQCT
jgi:hypothetical protein